MGTMIKLSYDEAVRRLVEASGLSQEDITSKINAKKQQLSGLVSAEGAAHIVANELGVPLITSDERAPSRWRVRDVKQGLRNVEVVGRVRAVYEAKTFKRQDGSESKVGSFMVYDETGVMRITCWGNQADILKDLAEGTSVLISGAYARENRGRVELHLNDNSRVVANPKGIAVPDIQQRPAMERKEIKNLKEGDENVEVVGTITQIFDPKFFEVCPTCLRRARPAAQGWTCETHGIVPQPRYSYVFNVFLDDGSENIRCVFFRNQADKLIKKQDDRMEEYRRNPASFEEVKTELLGNIIKIVGRVNKNAYFDRVELVAQTVIPEADPEEELQRLQTQPTPAQ